MSSNMFVAIYLYLGAELGFSSSDDLRPRVAAAELMLGIKRFDRNAIDQCVQLSMPMRYR